MATVSGTLTAPGQSGNFLFLRAGELATVSVSRTGSNAWSAELVATENQPPGRLPAVARFTSTTTGFTYRNETNRPLYLTIVAGLLSPTESIAFTIADVTGDVILQDWVAPDGSLAFRITDEGPIGGVVGPTLNVKAFGATGDGVTDDTAAIQRALDAAATADGGIVFFPNGRYKVTATLAITNNGVSIIGAGINSADITFTGTGELFRIGTDNGLPWDGAYYDGLFGISFYGLSIRYTGSGTPLDNGRGNYGAGTYAIRDWRGGSVRGVRLSIVGFEFAFWGIQSDINFFQDCIISYCHQGIYLGPRSDQATFDHIWTFGNDRVFDLEGARNLVVRRWISDLDGSASGCPVVIRASASGVGSYGANFSTTSIVSGIVFDAPWLENQGTGAVTVPAFFDLCNEDASQSGTVVIRDSIVLVPLYNAAGVNKTLLFVRCGFIRSVTVDGICSRPGLQPWSNLRAVFSVLANGSGGGATTPYLYFSDREIVTGRLIENYHASRVTVNIVSDLDATYTNNVVGGTGTVRMVGGVQAPYKFTTATDVWDPPNILDGAQASTTITVASGCAVGDPVVASLSRDLLGLQLTAYVSATNTVTVILKNDTGSPVDLGSSTVRVNVMRNG
jgi:hypothetical protein